jgi:hypothetical protein
MVPERLSIPRTCEVGMASKRASRLRLGLGCLVLLLTVPTLLMELWSYSRTLYRWHNAESEIRIYVESNFDTPADSVNYRVTHRGKIISYGYLGADSLEPRHFEQAATADGRLVCVYETDQLGAGAVRVLIIADLVAEECWPTEFDPESAPEILARWKNRYALLRKEHPHLPEVSYFDPPTNP